MSCVATVAASAASKPVDPESPKSRSPARGDRNKSRTATEPRNILESAIRVKDRVEQNVPEQPETGGHQTTASSGLVPIRFGGVALIPAILSVGTGIHLASRASQVPFTRK